MAHGHVSFVLGVQTGLGSIVHLYQGVKKGAQTLQDTGTSSNNEQSDFDIVNVLSRLSQLDKLLRREEVNVSWSLLGANPRSELPGLFEALEINQDIGNIVGLETIQDTAADALIYIPVNVQQNRQIEQLARLSMICPRTKHVTIAPPPRWTHNQLMALKETWNWVDPRAESDLKVFAEGIIKLNGGMTERELDKVESMLARPIIQQSKESNIIMHSPRMKELIRLVDAVADSDSTILISGDSGTGKELIAERIHAKSHRINKPLIAVNCGAIPGELLESELFGHVKGAFTGAISNREGRFEAAEGGTLFLDEIGEMGPVLQVKLLRVLQTRRYEPVGSTQSRNADVRIIAATNKDLEEMVKTGDFREDLFYRLNVIPVHVPALREKREDIPYLVEYFIKRFNSEKRRKVTGVTRAALRALVAYEWPGNVRELENLVERMVILKSCGMIDILDFPEKYRKVTFSEIEYDDLMRPKPKESLAQNNVAMGGDMASYENQFMNNNNINNNNSQGQSNQQGINSQSTNALPSQTISNGSFEGNIQSNADEVVSIEEALRMLSDRLAFPLEGMDFNSVVDQFENILILHALERTGWNRNRAAGLLRLNRTTLVEKLKKKQLVPPMRAGDAVRSGHA